MIEILINMKNYYKILNEIAAIFDIDQWYSVDTPQTKNINSFSDSIKDDMFLRINFDIIKILNKDKTYLTEFKEKWLKLYRKYCDEDLILHIATKFCNNVHKFTVDQIGLPDEYYNYLKNYKNDSVIKIDYQLFAEIIFYLMCEHIKILKPKTSSNEFIFPAIDRFSGWPEEDKVDSTSIRIGWMSEEFAKEFITINDLYNNEEILPFTWYISEFILNLFSSEEASECIIWGEIYDEPDYGKLSNVINNISTDTLELTCDDDYISGSEECLNWFNIRQIFIKELQSGVL